MRGIYMPGGYPDRKSFLKCFDAVVDAGFEFVEVGVPFSDPVADGPVIETALGKVIANGTTIYDIRDDLRKVKDAPIKTYVMTYSNMIYSYGISKFSEDFKDLIEGVIIADVPNRMHEYFYAKGFEIPIISFVTPESRKRDIADIWESKGDFIYFVGIRGITGGQSNNNSDEIKSRIAEIRDVTDKKIILGFGIRTKEDAKSALEVAGGFVVGTAAVKVQDDFAEYSKYIKSLI